MLPHRNFRTTLILSALVAFASAAVSVFHNGTAVPMAGVITACGLLAFVCCRWLARNDRSEER